MRPLIAILLALAMLTSCSVNPFANVKRDLSHYAEEKLKNSLAGKLVKALGGGVATVIDELARPGGYLDNPLVRLLLPPPITLAFDLVRDLRAKPDTNPLLVVMNRAAETAVPDAAPILQAALEEMTPEEARKLLDGGNTAGTDYLKAKTEEKLKKALAPTVLDSLAKNHGLEQYREILTVLQARQPDGQPAETSSATSAKPETIPDLGNYVTEKTVDGIFKSLGAKELEIREDLDLLSVDMKSLIQPEPDDTETPPTSARPASVE